MKKCLNKEELQALVDHKFYNKNIDYNTDIGKLIEAAEQWEKGYCIIGLNYFISKIIERKLKQKRSCKNLIPGIYKLNDTMSYDVQEFDSHFVEYLMHSKRNLGIELEEELIEIQENCSRFKYGKKFRS